MFKLSSNPAPRLVALAVFGAAQVYTAVRMVGLTRVGDGLVDNDAMVELVSRSWPIALAAGLAGYIVARLLRLRSSAHLRKAGYLLLAVGVALVLPLTLHLIWMAVVRGTVSTYGDWVELSVKFTGLSHIVFAGLTALRAWQLASGKPPLSIGIIYGCAAGAAMLPFPWLPPLIVAVTGLPILPLLYVMRPLAERDRAASGAALPTAIVERR